MAAMLSRTISMGKLRTLGKRQAANPAVKSRLSPGRKNPKKRPDSANTTPTRRLYASPELVSSRNLRRSKGSIRSSLEESCGAERRIVVHERGDRPYLESRESVRHDSQASQPPWISPPAS